MLSRIETPDYLLSKKGYSYIDNAKHHQQNDILFNIDIQKFFPSVSKNKVFTYFLSYLKMPPDIAKLMCKFTVFDNHLAQGLSTSPVLSYLVNQKMFLEIYTEVKDTMTMSIYVDDVTFSSSNNISKLKQSKIIKIVNKYGYKVKESKIKYFPKGKHKHVTGVVISPDKKLKVPNKLREKIIKQIPKSDSQTDINKTMLGRIHSARNIESNSFQSILNKTKSDYKPNKNNY